LVGPMSVERLHFEPDRMTYHWKLACEHVARYAFAAQFCRGRRVLDVACGEGYGSLLLHRAGAASVLGVDISSDAIAAANTWFAEPAIRYVVGDAMSLASVLKDEAPFDVIISLEALEHVADADRFLAEVAAARSPDAIVVISAPQEAGPPGKASTNPFHARTMTFEAFKGVTCRHLGPASSWHLGTPLQGIVICDAGSSLLDNDRTDLSLMMEAKAQGRSWMLPAQRELAATSSNCDFYVGVWGAEAATVMAASPASLSGILLPWVTVEWFRRENARLLREGADPPALTASPTGPRGRALAEAVADLRRAMLLDRERLEEVLGRVRNLSAELERVATRERAATRALAAAEARLADAGVAERAATTALETERSALARLRAEREAQVAAMAHDVGRLRHIEASRGWRLVQAYGRLLAHPVAGPPLRVVRRAVSWGLRLVNPS
jgi:SAM-dependent methyltransferase